MVKRVAWAPVAPIARVEDVVQVEGRQLGIHHADQLVAVGAGRDVVVEAAARGLQSTVEVHADQRVPEGKGDKRVPVEQLRYKG